MPQPVPNHQMEDKAYTDLDREIITLAAVSDLIGSMVHYNHFMKEHRLEEAMLVFRTASASKLFLIILADFLSVPSPGTLGLPKLKGEGSLAATYLGHLRRVVHAPQFTGPTHLLGTAVSEFAAWLDGSVTVDNVWLPSIERNGRITVQRLNYLKICGNISKHGFTRLDRIVARIRQVLADNGTEINEGQSYLLIPEFQEWFQDHVFIASATTIAWFLNEIRWGIYAYLWPEFQRSYTPNGEVMGMPMYKYDVPATVTDELVRSMYWDLMNNTRSPPYFPRFTVQTHLLRSF